MKMRDVFLDLMLLIYKLEDISGCNELGELFDAGTGDCGSLLITSISQIRPEKVACVN